MLPQDGDPEVTCMKPSCSSQAFPEPSALVMPLPKSLQCWLQGENCVKLEADSAHLSLFMGMGCSTENFLLIPS